MSTPPKKIRLFYDGSCGLCHYFVSFTLSRMSPQTPLFFSPLGGKIFKKIQKTLACPDIPDSLIVHDGNENQYYFKSQAIIKILSALGYPWKCGALLLRGIPTQLADMMYDFVAKIRHRLFQPPSNACPFIPENKKQFFED